MRRSTYLPLKSPGQSSVISASPGASGRASLEIHEWLFLSRNGQTPPGEVDYFSHMPIAWRRDALKAPVDMSAPGDEKAFGAVFEKMLATVRILHDRGVFIVFGTDMGGSFTYHRELELYQRVGM